MKITGSKGNGYKSQIFLKGIAVIVLLTTPNGALVFFECKDGCYQETGKIKGRYGLKCDAVKQLWILTDFHTHSLKFLRKESGAHVRQLHNSGYTGTMEQSY